MTTDLTIIIPIYDGVDLMDMTAPREVFHWMPLGGYTGEVKILYVAETLTPITTQDGTVITANTTFDESPQNPDVLWVPGGSPDTLGVMLQNPDLPFFQYVTRIGEKSRWVCSVCEGAVLLANTGLLNGHTVTTHHSYIPCMAAFPEVTVAEGYPRYVKSGNRVTGGGISSGIDEALFLVELLAGTAVATSVQVVLQYFPKPPVHGEIVPSTNCPITPYPPA